MNHPLSNPGSAPNFSELSNRVNAGVSLHQRKIRALAAAAFAFGFLTIVASIVVITLYTMFYQPKQNYLLKQVLSAAQAKQAAATSSDKTAAPPTPDIGAAQVTLTAALSYGVMFLAIAIGCLAIGTIVMVTLIVVQRRATLSHISTSLAQISEQLKALNAGAKA